MSKNNSPSSQDVMPKKFKLFIIVSVVILLALTCMYVIPIDSFKPPCTTPSNFSVLRGETNEFLERKADAENYVHPINAGVCWSSEPKPTRLFLL